MLLRPDQRIFLTSSLVHLGDPRSIISGSQNALLKSEIQQALETPDRFVSAACSLWRSFEADYTKRITEPHTSPKTLSLAEALDHYSQQTGPGWIDRTAHHTWSDRLDRDLREGPSVTEIRLTKRINDPNWDLAQHQLSLLDSTLGLICFFHDFSEEKQGVFTVRLFAPELWLGLIKLLGMESDNDPLVFTASLSHLDEVKEMMAGRPRRRPLCLDSRPYPVHDYRETHPYPGSLHDLNHILWMIGHDRAFTDDQLALYTLAQSLPGVANDYFLEALLDGAEPRNNSLPYWACFTHAYRYLDRALAARFHDALSDHFAHNPRREQILDESSRALRSQT